MRRFDGLGSWLARIKFSRQLSIAFAALIALSALLCAVAFVGLARVGAASDQLGQRYLPAFDRLADARSGMLAAREFEVKHSRAADTSYHAEYEDKLKEQVASVEAALKAIGSHLAADDQRQLLAAVDKEWAAYVGAQKKVLALGREKKQQDAADVSDGLASMAFDTALTQIDKLSRKVFDDGKGASAQAANVFRQTQVGLLGILAGVVGLGVLLAVVITRNVIRQLGGEPRQASEAVQAMAAGDLGVTIDVPPGQEDSLLGRIQAMQRSLSGVVQRVRLNADSVATASQEIASGNFDLSQRTVDQASSLQNTAASMEHVGATVRQNAENATQANHLATSASSIASSGGELARKVVETMREIDESSRRIADIIGVIDGIAFQTNILALNAAVEAARAGEQGRGFAVVAGEVRNLAQRSADAAKEIKSLITASVERVQRGTELVDQSGATMAEIVSAIDRVTQIMGEISSASVAQSGGVSEVGQAIQQMDQATQHNAALVEQTAAAAESLKQQAGELVAAVSVFRLVGERHR